jgi:hypothetical protein
MMTKEQVSAEAVIQAVLHRITTVSMRQATVCRLCGNWQKKLGPIAIRLIKLIRCCSGMGIIEYSDSPRQGYVVKHTEQAGPKSKKRAAGLFLPAFCWVGMAGHGCRDDIR